MILVVNWKEDLIDFYRENSLPTSGGKIEITNKIAYFLDTGKIMSVATSKKKPTIIYEIYEDSKIESNIVCSENHRAFFKEHICNSFL